MIVLHKRQQGVGGLSEGRGLSVVSLSCPKVVFKAQTLTKP